MNIGGLDVGTTGCKITVYSEKGELVHDIYKEYEVNRKNGEHEIDAEAIFESVCYVIGETVKKCEIAAIFELGENHIIKMKLGEVKIDYILDDKYKYIMLLNSGSKGKYICVEPQSWLSNCPNLKDRDKFGFAFINPNETISYNTCISLT